MKTNMGITPQLFLLALACLAATSLALTHALPASGQGALWITLWITSSAGAVVLAEEGKLVQ